VLEEEDFDDDDEMGDFIVHGNEDEAGPKQRRRRRAAAADAGISAHALNTAAAIFGGRPGPACAQLPLAPRADGSSGGTPS
jgi:hypothetical protein